MSRGQPEEGSPLSQSDEAVVHRVRFPNDEALVAKAFRQAWPVELRAYGLLARLGVPTLRHLVQPPNLLLLEDLERSPRWRLATANDLLAPATGAAVAAWYGALHGAGARLSSEEGGLPDWLLCEAELVTHASVTQAARRLLLEATTGIRAALAALPRLVEAYASLPQTLTYNDFYWSNLALSRADPTTAVVFDLHLLGRGPACADIRNVVGSLGPAAREAFLAGMGPVDPRHAALDRPMATLHGLVVAASRTRVPRWAWPLCQQARDGTLAEQVAAALDVAETTP